jgi:hypothetical protein
MDSLRIIRLAFRASVREDSAGKRGAQVFFQLFFGSNRHATRTLFSTWHGNSFLENRKKSFALFRAPSIVRNEQKLFLLLRGVHHLVQWRVHFNGCLLRPFNYQFSEF